jgi:hypothetical protein
MAHGLSKWLEQASQDLRRRTWRTNHACQTDDVVVNSKDRAAQMGGSNGIGKPAIVWRQPIKGQLLGISGLVGPPRNVSVMYCPHFSGPGTTDSTNSRPLTRQIGYSICTTNRQTPGSFDTPTGVSNPPFNSHTAEHARPISPRLTFSILQGTIASVPESRLQRSAPINSHQNSNCLPREYC